MSSLKKFIFTALLASVISFQAKSQVDAVFNTATFYAPETGTYVETYLWVIGSTANYIMKDSAFSAQLEVTYIFRQQDSVVAYNKFKINSPIIKDTLNQLTDFLDVQRLQIPSGGYKLEVILRDLNSTLDPLEAVLDLAVDFPKDSIRFSDIQLLSDISKSEKPKIFTKSGLDLIPYPSTLYAENQTKIKFYTELYNADKLLGANEPFLLNYYIQNIYTNTIVGSYRSLKRMTAQPVNVLVGEFNIERLATGNYFLVVEARNKLNEQIQVQKVFFQRINNIETLTVEDINSVDISSTFMALEMANDSLVEYVKCIRPIAAYTEMMLADRLLANNDYETLKKFFYNFWLTKNGADPEAEWRKYFEQVKEVERLYATGLKRGYDSDRGRVYLRYGKPNALMSRPNEPSNYPYEIWQYYKIDNYRSNGVFVFYNPNIGTEDYELLHSNVRGEINDYRWKYKLAKRSSNAPNLDDETDPTHQHWGNQVDDFFNNPR